MDPNTWSTTTVRNGEGLMQIQVTNIGTDGSQRGQDQVSIHVGTIYIDLSTMKMNDGSDIIDACF